MVLGELKEEKGTFFPQGILCSIIPFKTSVEKREPENASFILAVTVTSLSCSFRAKTAKFNWQQV